MPSKHNETLAPSTTAVRRTRASNRVDASIVQTNSSSVSNPESASRTASTIIATAPRTESTTQSASNTASTNRQARSNRSGNQQHLSSEEILNQQAPTQEGGRTHELPLTFSTPQTGSSWTNSTSSSESENYSIVYLNDDENIENEDFATNDIATNPVAINNVFPDENASVHILQEQGAVAPLPPLLSGPRSVSVGTRFVTRGFLFDGSRSVSISSHSSDSVGRGSTPRRGQFYNHNRPLRRPVTTQQAEFSAASNWDTTVDLTSPTRHDATNIWDNEDLDNMAELTLTSPSRSTPSPQGANRNIVTPPQARNVLDMTVDLTDSPVGVLVSPDENPPAASPGSGAIHIRCPVCLDDLPRIISTRRNMMSTVCGHIFCSTCLPVCIRSNSRCPTCRKILRPNDTHPIFI